MDGYLLLFLPLLVVGLLKQAPPGLLLLQLGAERLIPSLQLGQPLLQVVQLLLVRGLLLLHALALPLGLLGRAVQLRHLTLGVSDGVSVVK